MKKIIYINDKGTVSIVVPMPKDQVERVVGPLTDEEYENLVISRAIPPGTEFRFIDDIDVPNSREFRDAWVDITAESRIDICCDKAKAIGLERLRKQRNKKLQEKDFESIKALEDGLDIAPIKASKQALRDVTEPLKALDTLGKVNDDALLESISTLSKQLDGE